MIVSLIAAMAENRVIGNRHAIPWNIPSDQQLFKQITMGHALIFGRVTFEIIGRPLPGRRNIILTHRKDYTVPGILVAHSIQEALSLCRNEEEVFIGGGATVFHETIASADRVYLSVVHGTFEGDAFFPEIPGNFVEKSREEFSDVLPYSFIRYERG